MSDKISTVHSRVLRAIEHIEMGCGGRIRVEPSGRLDLPNDGYAAKGKGKAQRKKSLCYADAILLDRENGKYPRALIEVVDGNPNRPNGITGLAVNADRVADCHNQALDLVFVVLDQINHFYCARCKRGHDLARLNDARTQCLQKSITGKNGHRGITLRMLHTGTAMNFRKALIVYPIGYYLRRISAPSVVFLNITQVQKDWNSYKDRAMELIRAELEYVLSSEKRHVSRMIGLDELLPLDVREKLGLP